MVSLDARLKAESQQRKRVRHSLPVTGSRYSDSLTPAQTAPKQASSAPRERTASASHVSGSGKDQRRESSHSGSPSTPTLRIRVSDTLPIYTVRQQQHVDRMMKTIAAHTTYDDGVPRFTEQEDDVDEISLLGLAAIETSDSRSRGRSSEEFLDDMNFKMESPANVSIARYFQEDEDDESEVPATKIEYESPQSKLDKVGLAVTAELVDEPEEEVMIGDILPTASPGSAPVTEAFYKAVSDVVTEGSIPSAALSPTSQVSVTSVPALEPETASLAINPTIATESELPADPASVIPLTTTVAVEEMLENELPNLSADVSESSASPIGHHTLREDVLDVISQLVDDDPVSIDIPMTPEDTPPASLPIGIQDIVVENTQVEQADTHSEPVEQEILPSGAEGDQLNVNVEDTSMMDVPVIEQSFVVLEAGESDPVSHTDKITEGVVEDPLAADMASIANSASSPGAPTHAVSRHFQSADNVQDEEKSPSSAVEQNFIVNAASKALQTPETLSRAQNSIRSPSVHESPRRQAYETPSKSLATLPFAGEEFINTPARPIEDAYMVRYFEQKTPAHDSPSKILQRTPPHKEDAFVDYLPGSSERRAPAVDATPLNGDSFVSTAVDEESAGEDDAQAIQGTREEEMTNGLGTAIFATPQPQTALQMFAKEQKTTNGVLGSAIRLSSREPSPELSRSSAKTISEIQSAILATRLNPSVVSRSEPRKRSQRPVTPPPRKRYSMDIPLSKYNPSIEVWDNDMDSAPSPAPKIAIHLPAPRENLRTPSPRLRVRMDIPLPRERTPIEVWPAENGSRSRRRTLISPQQEASRLSSAQLIVDETPQMLSNSGKSQVSLRQSIGSMPKLDFGVPVEHSHTLSDTEDAPVQLQSPIVTDDEEDGMLTPVGMSSPQSLHSDHRDFEMPINDRRQSLLKHFTPRSSKLRQLARHLAEAKQIADDASDDEILSGEIEAPEGQDDQGPHVLTPKTAMRKQLSDDIDLDFAPETSTPLPTVDRQKMQSPNLSKQKAQPSPRIATPVFKSKRPRRQSTPPSVSPINAAELEIESPPVDQLKVASPPQAQAHKEQTKPKIAKSKHQTTRPRKVEALLTTFGVAPTILPRSRRERKKPVEYWKVNDAQVKTEVPRSITPEIESEVVAPVQARPRHKAPRKRARSPQPEAVPLPTKKKKLLETELETTKPSKRKKRPSDFDGPLTSHRKIKVSTSARPSPAPAPVPEPRKIRTYDFLEDEDDDTLA